MYYFLKKLGLAVCHYKAVLLTVSELDFTHLPKFDQDTSYENQ